MDVMKQRLQDLLRKARTWEDRIKKGTLSNAVEFSSDPATGEFSITASWISRDGAHGSYTKRFTRELVFGPEGTRSSRPHVRRSPCAYMREYMQEVLHSRGI